MDHTGLVELLDYTHSQLGKIRQAVAASDHAGTMFSIDCLVGAAAEQTRCKLASLQHAGLPIGKGEPIGPHEAASCIPVARDRPVRTRRLP